MREIQKEICVALNQPKTCLTNETIRSMLDGEIPRNQVNTAICKLVQHGFVERIEQGCYQLTKSGKTAVANDDFYDNEQHKKPERKTAKLKKRTNRDRIWTAIRILEKFTIDEVIIRSSANRKNTTNYVRMLERAGFIVKIRKAPDGKLTSNGVNVFRLVRNNGELAPIYSAKKKAVIDPNSHEEWEV